MFILEINYLNIQLYIHFEYVNEYVMYVHIYNCICSMHSCLHILQYTCIHEHPHNKDSIIISKYILLLLFCALYAIVARMYDPCMHI